jgi:hypothetical protein
MEKADFKIGDEIYLEKGVEVYANIPSYYVYSNRPFNKSLTNAKVTLGLLYTNEEITKRSIKEEANHIANIIFGAFLNKGYEIDFNECKKFVNKNIDIDEKIELTKFILPEGCFIITDMILHPEGRGHNDYYPPYWEYYAKRKDGEDEISFVNWQFYDGQWHHIDKQQPIIK